MTRLFTVISVVVLALAASSVLLAQKDAHMGTWKLNEAKSTLAPAMPKSNTVVYEAAGDDVKVTVDGTDKDGKATHNEWTGPVDGVHATNFVAPPSDAPVLVTIHDLIHLRHRNPLARLYARTMIGRAVRKSRRVLTVSESVRSELAAFGHPEKIIVTPNGVDALFFDAQAGLPGPHHNYFLFVGNDKPHKNVERLVEAFAIVRKSGKVKLVLAGGDFSRFAKHQGIFLAGLVPREQLATLYRGAIALVQPSIEEGFGLPAAEAMASGAVVITSTAPALVEVTGDGALHAAPDSIDEIANAMLRVMREPLLRATLIDRARKRAREFTWQRCAMITRDAYRAALG